MSNVALFNPSQVPAHVKARGELSAIAKALAGGGASGGKRVSIKGGVFRLISGGKEIAAIEERYLDVVVVNAAPKVSRVFYAAKYDADKVAAPDCWSADGVTPDAAVAEKPAAKCDACPNNIAGSGQGNSRACRYQQRLAVVQLTLPATSIFGKEEGEKRPLQAYARWLAAQNIDPSEVITRMNFDTKSESPKLFFKPMRWLDDEEAPVIKKQGQTADAKAAISMTVFKADTTTVSAPIDVPGKRAAKVEPVAEEEAEAPAPAPKAKKAVAPAADEGDEPVVRKEEKKPSAVPKAKASLAEMVDDWDEA
jgi:hypothetical protein